MKTRHFIIGSVAIFSLAILGGFLFLVASFLFRHKIVNVSFGSPTPEKIVWDFTTDSTIVRVDWPVSNKSDSFERYGDFDFTFKRGTRVFHERAQSFGCTRVGNQVSFWLVHFGGFITAEEAYWKAKQVLKDYGGGEASPNRTTAGGISLDEWYEQMKKGIFYYPTYYTKGIHGGGVMILIHDGHSKGLRSECSLAFNG